MSTADAFFDETPEDAAGYSADSSAHGSADDPVGAADGTGYAMSLPTTWYLSRLPILSRMRTACIVAATAVVSGENMKTYVRTK